MYRLFFVQRQLVTRTTYKTGVTGGASSLLATRTRPPSLDQRLGLHTQSSMASKQNGFPPNGAPESFGNFDLVKRVKLDFTDVQVSKWKSRETGLSIVHLDYEGAHLYHDDFAGYLTNSLV